jgi:5-(carboxyamino)imidazole ribonucleotide synthase
MNPFSSSFRLGILGGGQLGRMLIQSAIDFNLYVKVMDGDADAPCRALAHEFTLGKLTDFDAVYAFGKTVDVLTIEIEHVNVDALEKLEAEGVHVYPQPRVIRTIQDKRVQKRFYETHKIPLRRSCWWTTWNRSGSTPISCPPSRNGHDGLRRPRRAAVDFTGRSGKSLSRARPARKGRGRCQGDFGDRGPQRARRGGRVPAVELVFHPVKNLVEYLLAPAQLDERTVAQANEIALGVAQHLGIVGLLAVEMFVTPDGEVLVNESAPRPHNSGHHTIRANYTSQFEQHLRAILGLPLGDTDTQTQAAMVNLLGEEGHSGEAVYDGMDDILQINGVYPHLYGKRFTKPFRKMGHVTILDDDLEVLKEKIRHVQDKLKVVSRQS